MHMSNVDTNARAGTPVPLPQPGTRNKKPETFLPVWQRFSRLNPHSATELADPELPVSMRRINGYRLPTLWRLMQVSRAMMSRLTKEFAGITALEMLDQVKADGLRERLELDAHKFLRAAEAFFIVHPEEVPAKK